MNDYSHRFYLIKQNFKRIRISVVKCMMGKCDLAIYHRKKKLKGTS